MELREALSPMYYFSKLFAQMSYKFDTETNTYRIDYRAVVYGLTAAFATVYLFLTKGKDDLKVIEEDDQNSVSDLSNVLDFYSSVTNQTVIIVLNCVYVRKLIRLLTNLDQIDKQMNQLIITPINNQKLFIMCCWGIVIVLFEFNATFWPDITFFLRNGVVSYLISSYVPIIVSGVFKFQFFIYVYIITDRMRLLCEFLKQLEFKLDHHTLALHQASDLSKHSENLSFTQHFVEAIEKVHVIHQKLCDAYKEVNVIYSMPLLLNVISAFSENLTDLYYCYLLISEYTYSYKSMVDLYFTVQWCFMQISELIVIATICHKAHIQVQTFCVA